MLIYLFSMLLLASDAPKPTQECLVAAQRALDVWEKEAKGTSKEGSVAEADKKLGGRQRHLEFLAPKLFENQENCVFYSKPSGDAGLRIIAIGQMPDHPEHGVTRKNTPDDSAEMKRLIMQPPADNALQTLATPQSLKDLALANLFLSNCNFPGLTIVDTVLVAGTAQAVATKMGLERQQYTDQFVRPGIMEVHKEGSCQTNAKMTREIVKRVKENGAKIISDTRRGSSIMMSP